MSGSEVDPPAGVALAGGLSTCQPFPLVRVWLLTLTAGLIAGFTSWLIEEATHGRFGPPTLLNKSGPAGGLLSAPEIHKLTMAKRAAQTLDATLIFGSLGAVLGLTLGLAGGFARGSARSALSAAIVGSVCGGIVGAAVTRVILAIYFKNLNPNANDLIVGMLFHVAISSAIGAAGGAAFGIGLGDRRCAVRAAVGGLLGAAAGVLVHEMGGAVAFPLAEVTIPIPETWGTRLLACLAVTTLAAVGVAMGALVQKK
jgi:hypothetical protein